MGPAGAGLECHERWGLWALLRGHAGSGYSAGADVVVATSLLVSFTLPALVRLLAGTETGIPFWEMFRLLAIVIFSPLLAFALAGTYLGLVFAHSPASGP